MGPLMFQQDTGRDDILSFKKSQAQLPTDPALQIQKDEGRRKKKIAGNLQGSAFSSEKINIVDHGNYSNLSRFQG